jgi:hypothetical protein
LLRDRATDFYSSEIQSSNLSVTGPLVCYGILPFPRPGIKAQLLTTLVAIIINIFVTVSLSHWYKGFGDRHRNTQ